MYGHSPLLYGLGLNPVQLTAYTNHFKKSVGFGQPCRTAAFYVEAKRNPLTACNTKVNVLDNEKGIDYQAKKTEFADPKINHAAPDVPGYVPEAKEELFKPVATTESELKEALANNKRAAEEVGNGGQGDDLRVTNAPVSVTENTAHVPHVNKAPVQEPPPAKKRKKVYKGPTHRLHVTE